MGSAQTILIYGNSLFVAGVAAELGTMPNLSIERIDTADLKMVPQLYATCPTLLIVDLATTSADIVLTCLIECPTLVLIGLDLKGSRVVILSSKSFPVTTVQELTSVIQQLHQRRPS